MSSTWGSQRDKFTHHCGQESSFALFARPVLQQVAEQMEKLKNSELKEILQMVEYGVCLEPSRGACWRLLIKYINARNGSQIGKKHQLAIWKLRVPCDLKVMKDLELKRASKGV